MNIIINKILDELAKTKADIRYVTGLYLHHIYKTNPDNREKSNMNIVLFQLSEYYMKNRMNIFNISDLSKLASLFADELFFIECYDALCTQIENLLIINQTM
jgi:hypothetical protein